MDFLRNFCGKYRQIRKKPTTDNLYKSCSEKIVKFTEKNMRLCPFF